MRRLALSDEILLTVEKPARYTGGEIGSIYKDKKDINIRFAMCFPDVYEIGMSHLGIQILYEMFNRIDDVWCERVYSPWTDLDDIMRKEGIRLFALESQDQIRDFDFLGITLQYEMCYTNVLQVLDLSGIHLLSCERENDEPIVIGGGPCSYNPEPIADFFDLFYIGEGEVAYESLLQLYRDCRFETTDGVTVRSDKWNRTDFLRKASHIPGIYCPIMYDVDYTEEGLIRSFKPKYDDLPSVIEKQVVSDLSASVYPTAPIVPYIRVTQDRMVLEIMRGCIRGCRFCQAGQLYKPLRERDPKILKQYAKKLMDNTGHEEISLSSLSSSDYSGLEQLLDFLMTECSKQKVNIALPSLRIDSFSLDVMNKVQDVKKSSLTFAPEAGSQRMRDVINKGLTKDDILSGAKEAFKGGWNKVKLYFMLGLPSETEDDIKAIGDLAEDIARLYYDTVPKEERKGKIQITVSTSFFVPKPFTPFQWAKMDSAEDFHQKAAVLKDHIRSLLNQKSIKYNWHDSETSVLEGVFARGDRRLSGVILSAYESGCIFDAWTEQFDNDIWMKCFDDAGLDIDFYTTRDRNTDEILPWDFISCGVDKAFFVREWENALSCKPGSNCLSGCMGCGASKYRVGICPR